MRVGPVTPALRSQSRHIRPLHRPSRRLTGCHGVATISESDHQADGAMAGTFQFDIAEEYFLVDAETKSVPTPVSERFLSQARSATAGQVKGEVNQTRIEVATTPHVEVARAREELRHLRQSIGMIAAKHKLAILAAGT